MSVPGFKLPTMYNFREKSKHLKNLLAPNHAERDLEMLKRLDPQNDQLNTFAHAPIRNAERILYLLLDVASAEDIRNNRRNANLEAEKAKEYIANLEEENEILQEELDEKDAELEAEKKSEPESSKPVAKKKPALKVTSVKKKTNTPKSTGRNSKTKTSK